MRDELTALLRFVTEHNVLVVVLLLLATAGVAAGTSQLQLESQANGSGAIGDTEVAQKADYVEANYGTGGGDSVAPAAVYVRDADGNALSKPALLDALRFQQDVRANESLAGALRDDGTMSVATVVGQRAAGSDDATLDEQIAAVESASESDVAEMVAEVLRPDSPAMALVPREHEPGTASASSTRIVFQFEAGVDDDTRRAATAALFEAAQGTEDPEYFTAGRHAARDASQQFTANAFQLVLPIALALILAVLAFAYRDLVDVVVGFLGVAVSVLWMFGILGWLQIPAGLTLVVGPVLIVGLSVDYGLHVFMRYREERGEAEDVREPMLRGLTGVAVALALVTLTAGVGFMANVTSDFTSIKELSVGITLGVLSTLVVSLTLVPALKVSVDNLLERVGFDRRKPALGKTPRIEPLLASGATLARKAAPAVIVLALVAGAAGGAAWTQLDRQAFQQGDGEVAEWKQDLPEPMGWDVHEYYDHTDHVAANYRAADEDQRRESSVLVEGSVTDPAALESLQAIHDRAGESDVVFRREGSTAVLSPLSLMQAVAAEDDSFAATYRDADTDGDGVPDRDVAELYDALYATAPDRASQVIERTGDEYRSLRAVVPIRSDADSPAQADAMQAIAGAAADETTAVSAIAVGDAVLSDAEARQTARNILQTLVVALSAVAVLLTVVYRWLAGSATLGAVTAVPIALVTALVIGGMYVMDVPLTLLTALLLSLVVGLGIDYNIHVSDRFAHELRQGRSALDAVYEAVTGTGGALLGSSLTTVSAFSSLMLVPSPQMQSFGVLVVLAMSLSFVVAVFVLPSLLLTWDRFVRDDPAVADRGPVDADGVSQD